ncbi:MAG: DUF6452 family protein [Bacteroidota bacterium]
MKRLLLLLLLLTIVQFSSCEKDDICVEGDTPLLIIGFFDFDDTTASRNTPRLRVRALEPDTIINTFNDRTNNDSIALPLRIDSNSTGFVFIINSRDDADTGEALGNRDTLQFNYEVTERFVSRACGFVANYNSLDTIRQVDPEGDWIRRITVVDTNIVNSNAIHVKIFF